MDLQYLKESEARRLSQGADEEFKMLKVSLWLMECLGRLLFITWAACQTPGAGGGRCRGSCCIRKRRSKPMSIEIFRNEI
jgi:hypothetical protein